MEPDRMCLGCDRVYYGRGICFICTKENFNANGLAISIVEMVAVSGAMLQRPDLIVRTTCL